MTKNNSDVLMKKRSSGAQSSLVDGEPLDELEAELREFQKRIKRQQKEIEERELLKTMSEDSQDYAIIKKIFFFVRARNLKGLKEFMNQLEDDMILRIPFLFDQEDGGKNVIHKCAQAKSFLMLECTVENYSERAK